MDAARGKSSFELLISAASSRMPIPTKVILLIKRYYTSMVLPINMYIAYNYTSSVHEMQLYNVVHDTTETFKTYNYSTSFQHNDGAKCSIYHAALPLSLQKQCARDGTNHLSTAQTRSQRWSMVATIGKISELFAFPFSITADESAIYGVYKFKLPPFPKQLQPSTVTFNHSTNTLYAMNAFKSSNYFQSESHTVYKLNFFSKRPEWELASGSIKSRHNTTSCMVDHDRCIAIFGGDSFGLSSTTAEIYALNSGKAVMLKDMQFERDEALSVYHPHYHRLIVADTWKEKQRYYPEESRSYWSTQRHIEWYDINKNEWTLLRHDVDMHRVGHVLIPEMQPHLVVFVGSGANEENVVIYQHDLRTERGGCTKDLGSVLPRNVLRYDVSAIFL